MIKNELLPGLIYAQKEFDKIAANVKDYDKYKRREAGRASAILRGLVNNIVNQTKLDSSKDNYVLPKESLINEELNIYNTGYLKEINDYFFSLGGTKLDSPSIMKDKLTTNLMNIYVKWNMNGVASRHDVPIIEHVIHNWAEVITVYINGKKITSLQWPR
ncbi:hypothetical protein [Pseudomonas phage U1B]|nr:hypothetical protein [Pseudomonas phage T2P]QYV99161.1 hypothetical protein [Pseudomonas phage U1B]QYV99616.1 hypothetical protein [Pseudomonas phage U5]